MSDKRKIINMSNKRKSLCVDEKVTLIRALEKGEKKSALGRRLGFSPSTVSTIWKNKDKILKADVNGGSTSKKLKRPKYESLDQTMLAWYHSQHQNNIHVSGPIIKAKAEEIAKQLGVTTFKASEGWLGKFKKRHHIKYDSNTATYTTLDKTKVKVKSEDLSQSEAEDFSSSSEKETEQLPTETNNQRVFVQPSPLHINCDALASIWTEKLERIHPIQKLFAEKAINDILFEAELGNLNRNSVRINEPPVAESTSWIVSSNMPSSSCTESMQQE